jgi:hypothetical protein
MNKTAVLPGCRMKSDRKKSHYNRNIGAGPVVLACTGANARSALIMPALGTTGRLRRDLRGGATLER